MVNLVEFCDQLEHTFLLAIGLDFYHTIATSGRTTCVRLQVPQDFDDPPILVKYGRQESLSIEWLGVGLR